MKTSITILAVVFCVSAAAVSTPEEIAAAGLTADELQMFEGVKEHITAESFAAVPWHIKKTVAIIAAKVATGELDGKMVPAHCFYGNVPPDVIEYINNAYLGGVGPKFNEITDRWVSTASPGTVNVQGGPAVLTWSIVPDGTFINGDPTITDTQTGLPMADGNSNLKAFLNGLYGSEAAWLALFQQVFNDWGSQTGITYLYESNDDGAAFPESGVSNGQPGQLGVRGDIRIGGIRIDGQNGPHILAFNFFPDCGDMLIDTGDSSFYGNSLGLRNVVAHEHGHGIGMPHTCPIDETKLLEPFLTFAFDGVQPDDRLSGQRTYGDPNEKLGGNDTSANATSLGTISNSSSTQSAISIDDDSDVDYFEFTLNTASDVTVTMTPIGTTYLSGEQMLNGTCEAGTSFNALAVANLSVQLIDTDGTTVLASGNSGAAGIPESISDFNIVTPGTYFVRVFQAASVNNVQGYDLTVDAAEAGPPAPVTNFSADVTSGSAPLSVTFTDSSTESPTSWAWDFENNGSTDSTDQNPSHVYNTPGVYTVKLTATNANGSDDEIKTNYITVTQLETSVQVSPGAWVEVGDDVTMTAGPGGAISYQWYKDSAPMGGETNQTLQLVSVVQADSGEYYCEVTTAAKGVANTPTVTLVVFALGTLPVFGAIGGGVLLGALAAIAILVLRRSRRTT